MSKFPEDLTLAYEFKLTPEGSTGARYYKFYDKTTGEDRTFVFKQGNFEDHIVNECYADRFYNASGIPVPEFRLYETDRGPAKLAEFHEGMLIREAWAVLPTGLREVAREQLWFGFPCDVLLGNWDVCGSGYGANVLFEDTVLPLRIDNGGAMRYRAQGALKNVLSPFNWLECDLIFDDLWTMTGEGKAIGYRGDDLTQYFGFSSPYSLATEIVSKSWDAAIAQLPDADRRIVRARIRAAEKIAEQGADCVKRLGLEDGRAELNERYRAQRERVFEKLRGVDEKRNSIIKELNAIQADQVGARLAKDRMIDKIAKYADIDFRFAKARGRYSPRNDAERRDVADLERAEQRQFCYSQRRRELERELDELTLNALE